MKKTNEEFNYTVEIGRDRPSAKFSGPLGSGESHGMPAVVDPVPAFIALVVAVVLLLGAFAIVISAAQEGARSQSVPVQTNR